MLEMENSLQGGGSKIFKSICEKSILRSTHIFMIFYCSATLFSEALALTFSSHHGNKDTNNVHTMHWIYEEEFPTVYIV